MHMWRRLLAVLCVLTCLLTLAPMASAVDETVYVRKHVSLLYDDSGSMNQGAGNLKWCYASYAAQTFAGLLNETDTLELTFMNPNEPSVPVDLTQDRQDTVTSVMQYTSGADNDTPIGQIDKALKALKLDEAQGQSDQHWLVLTTDGVFYDAGRKCTEKELADKIKKTLKDHPELKVVYFGIGTENDSSDQKAIDLRENPELKGEPNFSAEYAESHTEIVTTMRELANRIAGRYDVDDTVTFSGSTVTLDISGETSPIRNISVFAQNTNAKLVRAVASNGKELSVERSASISYPYNGSYTNVSDGTLGGCTALVETGNEEKIPAGKVTLTFSETVSEKDLSLMYEPAIYIDLRVERKNADGQWEKTDPGDKLYEGDELRVNYAICEDGTDAELDAAKLFGKSEEYITYNGETVKKEKGFTAVEGTQRLTIDLSLMDGLYRLSSGRTIVVTRPGASDYEVRSGGSLTMTRKEIAENRDAHIRFEVFLDGAPVDKGRMKAFSVTVEGPDGSSLDGKTTAPADNAIQFTPKDGKCEAGEYAVTLQFDGAAVKRETVTVEPNPTTYSAQAGEGITIMSNRLADNDRYVTFTVTAHADDADRPITAEEAGLFRVEAVSADGQTLHGKTEFTGGGQISFTPQDANAPVGDYTVRLKQQEQTLAEASAVVLLHNMVYSIETFVRQTDMVDWFKLGRNENHVAFVVRGDAEPCTAAQIQAMLDSGDLTVRYGPESTFLELDVAVGEVDGNTALICTPDGAGSFLRAFARCLTGVINEPVEQIDIGLTVKAVHGAEASEQMTVSYEGRGDWLIVLLILLALAVLLAWQIGVNKTAAKMRKTVLYHCRVSVKKVHRSSTEKLTVNVGKDRIGRAVMLGFKFGKEERASRFGIDFYAKRSRKRHRRGESSRCYPSLLIAERDGWPLEDYRVGRGGQGQDFRENFMRELMKYDTETDTDIPALIDCENGKIDLKDILTGDMMTRGSTLRIEKQTNLRGETQKLAEGDFQGSFSYVICENKGKYELWFSVDVQEQKKVREKQRQREQRKVRRASRGAQAGEPERRHRRRTRR